MIIKAINKNGEFILKKKAFRLLLVLTSSVPIKYENML